MCKKILVTGAGGYIGQHVVKVLLDKGADVIATDIRLDDVDDRLEKKLLEYYNRKLIADPTAHDKIEFELSLIHI